jgi:hypothetical protein
VPHVGRNPRGLVDHDSLETKSQDRLGIVGAQEQDSAGPVGAGELGPNGISAGDGDEVARDGAEGFYSSLGDEVGWSDPTVIPGGLSTGPVEEFGGKAKGLAPSSPANTAAESSGSAGMDGKLSGVGNIVEIRTMTWLPPAQLTFTSWGSRGMMIWRKNFIGSERTASRIALPWPTGPVFPRIRSSSCRAFARPAHRTLARPIPAIDGR